MSDRRPLQMLPVAALCTLLVSAPACRPEKVPPRATPADSGALIPESTSAGAPPAGRAPVIDAPAETVASRDTSASVGTDAWADARRRGVDFRAVGQEPGWYAEVVDGDRITIFADYGDRQATLPATRPVVDGASGRTTYRVRTAEHTLELVAERRRCNDGMSGAAYPETVTMTLDGRQYRGCGRAP